MHINALYIYIYMNHCENLPFTESGKPYVLRKYYESITVYYETAGKAQTSCLKKPPGPQRAAPRCKYWGPRTQMTGLDKQWSGAKASDMYEYEGARVSGYPICGGEPFSGFLTPPPAGHHPQHEVLRNYYEVLRKYYENDDLSVWEEHLPNHVS